MSLAYNIAKLTGPGIAGVMLAAYGAGRTMLVPAGLMLASVAVIAGLRPIRPEGGGGEMRSMLREILEGAAAMKRNPVVVALFLNQVAVYAIMVPAVYGLLPIYAADVIGVGPAGLGVLNSSLGAGAIAGVLIMATLGSAVPRGWATLVIMTMAAVAMIAFSQTDSMPAAIAMLVLFNACLVAMTAIKSSGTQHLMPKHLRGRVAALTTMSNGTMWIGGFVFGALAQWQNAPAATLVGAAVVLASVAGLYVWYPQLRAYR
jgi:predicted MFS family arabinose efflux permease